VPDRRCVNWSKTPKPMSAAAEKNEVVIGSRRTINAINAPKKGAVE
jgi:hypothetical protein